MKTIIKKGSKKVTIIEDEGRPFLIEETGKEYEKRPIAMRAAKEYLAKATLSEKEYEKRKEFQIRLRNAKKVMNVYNCLLETETFIKRWYDVIYLETKKSLHAEIKLQLDDMCKKYRFDNAHSAIGVIERGLKLESKKR